MKKVHDIFKEFEKISSNTGKVFFCEQLKKYTNEETFKRQYFDFLFKIERRIKPKPDKQKIQDLVRNNTKNWFNSKSSIKRTAIIDIAFTLADPEQKNGEIIANELLNLMGYPKLHASSLIEIFYIYAFRNGLTYCKCLDLIESYLSSEREQTYQSIPSDETSTVFHNELNDIITKDQLFSFVDAKKQSFGIASRKISKIIVSTVNKMCFTRFLISCHNDQADIIAEYIANNEISFPKLQKSEVFVQLKASPIETFVKPNKSREFYDKLVEMGAEVQMDPGHYKNQMDLILDFFLCFSCDLSLSEFKKEFSLLGKEDVDTAMNRNDYNDYIKKCGFFNFYSIKGHNNKDADGCAFSTVFEGLTKVMRYKHVLSREGLILLLLFYYHREDGDGKISYFKLDDINDFISSRYLRLDERLYFDKFIITILSFSIEEGKLKYKGELIENTDDLNLENIHKLRRCIIKKFEDYFDCNCAADNFIDTENSTTRTIKKRLHAEFEDVFC